MKCIQTVIYMMMEPLGQRLQVFAGLKNGNLGRKEDACTFIVE